MRREEHTKAGLSWWCIAVSRHVEWHICSPFGERWAHKKFRTGLWYGCSIIIGQVLLQKMLIHMIKSCCNAPENLFLDVNLEMFYHTIPPTTFCTCFNRRWKKIVRCCHFVLKRYSWAQWHSHIHFSLSLYHQDTFQIIDEPIFGLEQV